MKNVLESTIREISQAKQEPEWMLDFRLNALAGFKKHALPKWGPDLSELNFDDILYYVKPQGKSVRRWEDVPDHIQQTFDKLGVPEAERQFLAGVGAQYDSEIIYQSLKESLQKQGVIFLDPSIALREHEDLFKKYFGAIVPPSDNMFAALNSAVWSGGSFVYVPAGVKVEMPLQAYFRINAERLGQFERTLIIAEEDSALHYIEGCTAPVYSTSSLHAGVVEIIVKKGAQVRYTTIQNWSQNVYNLVTKRAKTMENAFMEWVDCNIGSCVTMKYPSVILAERGARASMRSLSYAGEDQHQDTGAKMIHLAPDTTSTITAKSVSRGNGCATYRGLVKVEKNATNARSKVFCGSILLDANSRADTYPALNVETREAQVEHEASVYKISENQLYYLKQRGLSEEAATAFIVNGFFESIVKDIPPEYAVELNRLIEFELE